MTALPAGLLHSWPGRFRFPELLVVLASAEQESEPEGLARAMLEGLATERDEQATAEWLIARRRFRAVEYLLADCQQLPETVAETLRRKLEEERAKAQRELASRLADLERAAMDAEADVPALLQQDQDALTRQADEDWTAVDEQLGTAARELRDAMRPRVAELAERVRNEADEESSTALNTLLEAGKLQVVTWLLDKTDTGQAPPEAVPPAPALPGYPAEDLLLWHRHPDSLVPPEVRKIHVPLDGTDLLTAYDGLRHKGEDSAAAMAGALAKFLGASPPASSPRPIHGGYFVRLPGALDDPRFRLLIPVPTLDLFIGAPDLVDLSEDNLLDEPHAVIAPSLSAGSRAGRGQGAIIDLTALLRLAQLREDRRVGLLRFLAPQWPLNALRAGSAAQLASSLGDASTRLSTLRWITDLAGLGGIETAAVLGFQSDFQPHVLHALLEYLAEPGAGDVTRRRLRELQDWHGDLPASIGLEAAVLQPARDHHAAVLAFWAALAAAPPGTLVSAESMLLEAELCADPGADADSRAVESLVRMGIAELRALKGMVDTADPDGIRLPKSGVMLRLRGDARDRLQRVLASDARPTGTPGGGLDGWTVYQYALSPAWPAGRSLVDTGREVPADMLARLQADLEGLTCAEDAAPVALGQLLTEMSDRITAAHPEVRLVMESVQDAETPFPASALRTVMYELLSNSAEAMNYAGDISVTARPSHDKTVIRVRDSGPGISDEIEDSHQPFSAGVSTRPSRRGHGLYRARKLLQQHGGDIALEERSGRHPVFCGADFSVVLPGIAGSQ
jgi:signal transduction histidine kinase